MTIYSALSNSKIKEIITEFDIEPYIQKHTKFSSKFSSNVRSEFTPFHFLPKTPSPFDMGYQTAFENASEILKLLNFPTILEGSNNFPRQYSPNVPTTKIIQFHCQKPLKKSDFYIKHKYFPVESPDLSNSDSTEPQSTTNDEKLTDIKDRSFEKTFFHKVLDTNYDFNTHSVDRACSPLEKQKIFGDQPSSTLEKQKIFRDQTSFTLEKQKIFGDHDCSPVEKHKIFEDQPSSTLEKQEKCRDQLSSTLEKQKIFEDQLSSTLEKQKIFGDQDSFTLEKQKIFGDHDCSPVEKQEKCRDQASSTLEKQKIFMDQACSTLEKSYTSRASSPIELIVADCANQTCSISQVKMVDKATSPENSFEVKNKPETSSIADNHSTKFLQIHKNNVKIEDQNLEGCRQIQESKEIILEFENEDLSDLSFIDEDIYLNQNKSEDLGPSLSSYEIDERIDSILDSMYHLEDFDDTKSNQEIKPLPKDDEFQSFCYSTKDSGIKIKQEKINRNEHIHSGKHSEAYNMALLNVLEINKKTF